MGNKDSASRGASPRSAGSWEHADQDASEVAEQAERQVREALAGVATFDVMLKEKTMLSGLFRQRAPEQDTVAGMSPDAALDVWRSLRARSKAQTSRLLAKQEQLDARLKRAALSSEAAHAALRDAAADVSSDCASATASIVPLVNEVQNAAELLHACAQLATTLNAALPEEERLEPLVLK